MKIVLASQSPRRKELLGRMGLEFVTQASKIDESAFDGLAARELVAAFCEPKLFTDEKSVRRLLHSDGNLFMRVYYWVRDMARKLVDIAVIRLPKISNFTDFSPFERYENVSLRYVDHVGALGTPDMILLPGTKSTIADLRWLRERGLEAAILKEAAGGTLVFGVCGGYQMLGRSVSDPEGVEAAGLTELRGMGLLEMETVFHGEKVQRQTAGMFSGVEGMLAGLNELRYEGYEIHMGRSEAQMPALAGNGNVYGSYVHGIFDAPGIADEILKAICARRGVAFSALGTFDRAAYRERQYDLLADAVRAGLDMEFVYRVLRKEI